MRKVLIALSAALLLSSCAALTNEIQSFSSNYQAEVTAINADIAASAPAVATACTNLQGIGILLVPFVANNVTASATLAEVNAGLASYCQNIPTNINQTVASIGNAIASGQAAYNAIKSGVAK